MRCSNTDRRRWKISIAGGWSDIERSQIVSPALGEWVSARHCILITGPTGVGKSWLACAPVQYACRRGSPCCISQYRACRRTCVSAMAAAHSANG
ncbi:ATP-binding protein [Paraburkholderia humisilvae]|uniref:ATP-binding protein n=1 Tax=Paraburkholderia humisilvae TaxID=627669 RepID=UPI001FE4713A|nr:ATP-binding protein [Paraburkholderia humisilvae]